MVGMQRAHVPCIAAAVALTLVVSACGTVTGPGPTPITDGETQLVDRGTEAAQETESEAEPKAESVPTTRDASEVDTESASETFTVPEQESTPEAGTKAEPGATPDPELETDSTPQQQGEAAPIAEPGPDAVSDSTTASESKPRLESERESEPDPKVPELSVAEQPIVGDDSQIAEVYGRLLSDLMERWGIPGGAFAFARDGRLLFAGGYGSANTDTHQPVRPDSLFRIASVSKPITAVAVLMLVEDGRLNLDDRAFDLLLPEVPAADPRLRDITVRQLLHHSAGWNAAESIDPMWNPHLVARHLGVPKPVSCAQTVRFMLAQPLDHDPGERYAYSNFGYCVLGLIIETVTRESYEEYVTGHILRPLGITRMHIGSTLAAAAAEGEVRYVGYPGEPLAQSVVSDEPGPVPWPYGGFHLRAMEAHGGWVASVIDLTRFAVAVDGSKPPALLSPRTVETMLSSPDLRSGSEEGHHYGMGWLVRPVGDEANWWHDGSLPGTSSLLVRTHEGMVWSVLFNSRPEQWATFMSELDTLMWQGLAEIDDWPSHDLFNGDYVGS